jgi:hypothetical protein
MTPTTTPIGRAIAQIEAAVLTVTEMRTERNADYFDGLRDAYGYVLWTLRTIDTAMAEPGAS